MYYTSLPNEAIEILEKFCNTAADISNNKTNQKITIQIKLGSKFAANCYKNAKIKDFETATIICPDKTTKGDKKHTAFCSYWKSQYPFLQSFSRFTLVILHELGHLETDDDISESFTDFKRWLEIDNLEAMYFDGASQKEIEIAYFNFTDEYAASTWAWNWLMNEENQKIAKQFENDFLAILKTTRGFSKYIKRFF